MVAEGPNTGATRRVTSRNAKKRFSPCRRPSGMGRPTASAVDATTPDRDGLDTNQPSAMDNQCPSASREIFQGLFKDLGKQAMAMESILRLVCGKVDKLENWMTEMSFGMTELDLKLRNIAHNIEGTAANVDEAASMNRWAVPPEEDAAEAKAKRAAASVVKKVGVGPNKKKQMRVTGMVANILDQLTSVAEAPASESESEHSAKRRKSAVKVRNKHRESAVEPTGSPDSTLRTANHKGSATPKRKVTKDAEKAKVVEASASSAPKPPHREEKAQPSGQPLSIDTTHVAEVDRSASTKAGEVVGILDDANCRGAILPDHDTKSDHVVHKERPASSREAPMKGPVGGQSQLGVREEDEEKPKQKESTEQANIDRQQDPDPADRNVDHLPPTIEALTPRSVSSFTDHEHLEEGRRSKGSMDRVVGQVAGDSPTAELYDRSQTSRDDVRDAGLKAPERDCQEAHLHAPATKPLVEPLPLVDDPKEKEALNESAIGLHNEIVVDDSSSTTESSAQLTVEPLTASPLTHSIDTTDKDTPQAANEPTIVSDGENTATIDEPDSPTPNPDIQPRQSSSKKLTKRTSPLSLGDRPNGPTVAKRSSRKASIRQAVAQRQSLIQKEPLKQPVESLRRADAATKPPGGSDDNGVTPKPAQSSESAIPIQTIEATSCDDDNGGDNDVEDDEENASESDDDEDSSPLSSDSDESVLDLVGGSSTSLGTNESVPVTAADKKMGIKMTRTLTALNKLKKANVLTPEEIEELKQRATQKWFKLRDHIKDKHKKDVTNILLKRKKNIFTVSNRIELLEEKSREVFASIKQLHTELHGKVESSAFDGLRRHVNDVQVSLQMLDQKISHGKTPTMDHIKDLARDLEKLQVLVTDQVALAREHCDQNQDQTLKLFEKQWERVEDLDKSIHDKIDALGRDFDEKLLKLPDYRDAIEAIRKTLRKKADLKALKELEARLLGQEADSEDCLVRCLSCHKEVVNTTHFNAEDVETVERSPHFKRVNPGMSSPLVYRSNIPLNAQPIGIPESTPGGFESSEPGDASGTPSGTTIIPVKQPTPSRRPARLEEQKPSPLSYINITATRALAANDSSRPISAPASSAKKKAQGRTN